MPTYKNNTNNRITFQDKNRLHWQPGQIRRLHFFVPHQLLGLTLIDDEPYVLRNNSRGFGYTEFLVPPNEKIIFHIPYSETIELSILSPKGLVKVFPGDCLEPFVVDERGLHVSRYPWDMIAFLTFELLDETQEPIPVFIKVEPFTQRGE